MRLKEMLVKEFENRVFGESYQRIYKCLNLLNDEQLWSSPNGNIPSAGCLILHLCGNARQWILSGLGGAPDNRNREGEFIIQHNIRKSDFIFLLENLRIQLTNCLKELPEEEFEAYQIIQGFKVNGFSAVIHVIEHFSYHTGQITTLTKIYTNEETGYYSGLNLNIKNLN